MREKGRVSIFEPLFFFVFSFLQLSRLWAFTNKRAFAAFWQQLYFWRGILFYVVTAFFAFWGFMGVLLWFKGLGTYTPWWRWPMLIVGGIALGGRLMQMFGFWPWEALLLILYDTTNPLWHLYWGAFIVVGCCLLLLGIYLGYSYYKQQRQGW